MKGLIRNTWLQAFGVMGITSAILTIQSLPALARDVNEWRGSIAPPAQSASVQNPAAAVPIAPTTNVRAAAATQPASSLAPSPAPAKAATNPAPSPVAPTPVKARPTVNTEPVSAGGVDEFQKGMSFYDGVGVGKDFRRAAEYFERSAAAGNSASMAKLGWMFWFGEGVDPDARQGAEWFRRGAKAGNPEAQFWLATFYEKGYGNVKKDDRQALEWLRRSAAQGFPKAVAALQSRGVQ